MSDLAQNAETLLVATNVDLSVATQTTLYTVPAGKRLILTKVVMEFDSNPNSSVITVGQQGALTDFLPAQTLSNPTSQYDVAIMRHIDSTPNTPDVLKSYGEYTPIQADVTTNTGGVLNKLFLFGFLF